MTNISKHRKLIISSYNHVIILYTLLIISLIIFSAQTVNAEVLARETFDNPPTQTYWNTQFRYPSQIQVRTEGSTTFYRINLEPGSVELGRNFLPTHRDKVRVRFKFRWSPSMQHWVVNRTTGGTHMFNAKSSTFGGSESWIRFDFSQPYNYGLGHITLYTGKGQPCTPPAAHGPPSPDDCHQEKNWVFSNGQVPFTNGQWQELILDINCQDGWAKLYSQSNTYTYNLNTYERNSCLAIGGIRRLSWNNYDDPTPPGENPANSYIDFDDWIIETLPNSPPPQTCSDGTPYNQCSATKPKFCDNGNLISSCGPPNNCGCPNGLSCQLGGSCLSGSNQPPTATITQPTQISFTVNTTINYAGTGTDQEEGSIPSARLCWSYDILEDALGFISLECRSSGTFTPVVTGGYILKLVATDSQGLSGVAMKNITISPRTTSGITISNIVERSVISYPLNSIIQFSGNAQDPDGGDIPRTSLRWSYDVIGDGRSSVDLGIGYNGSFRAEISTGHITVYNLQLVSNDGELSDIDQKDIYVLSTLASNTCSQAGGICCQQGYSCRGSYLNVSGCNSCCSGICKRSSNRPPNAIMIKPKGSRFNSNVPIEYEGTGLDPDQGNLSESNLLWVYRVINGDSYINLGTGSSGVFSPSIMNNQSTKYTLKLVVKDDEQEMNFVLNDLTIENTGGSLPNNTIPPTEPPQVIENHWLEIENGLLTLPISKYNDTNASNGQFVGSYSQDGSAQLSFDIQHSESYFLWMRTRWFGGDRNSLFVSLDNQPEFGFGNDYAFNEWHWINTFQPNQQPELIRLQLNTGRHTLKLRGREAGGLYAVDKLLITNDVRLIPDGFGSQAENLGSQGGGGGGGGPGVPNITLQIVNLAPSTYQISSLQQGQDLYIGNTEYIIYQVPSRYNNIAQIRTKNTDKARETNPWITFSVNKESTVYVVWDDRMSKGDWMSSWQDTNEDIIIDGRHDGLHVSYITYSIYKKDYNVGEVSLGPPNGLHFDGNMYFVLVKEKTQLSPFRNFPLFERFVKPFKFYP